YHVHDIHQEPISILTARTSSSSAPDSSGSSAGSNTPVSGSRNPTSVTAAQPVQESRMNRSSTSSGSNTRTVRIAKPLNDWVAPHGAPAGTSGASVAWVNAVWWNANASSGARAGTDTTSNPASLPITASRSAESEPGWWTWWTWSRLRMAASAWGATASERMANGARALLSLVRASTIVSWGSLVSRVSTCV